MLLTTEVEVVVNSNHLKYYKDLGYNSKFRKILKVRVEHLPKNSRAIVEIKCSKCGSKKNIQYRQYSLKKDGKYYCSKCNPFKKKRVYTEEGKNEMINKIKKSFSERTKEQEKIRIQKTKLTKKNNHNSETYNNQEKKRKTLKKKYGSETYNNPQKRKETCLIKYGDKNFNNQEKKKDTCLEKYGVEHSNHNTDIFDKIQKNSFSIKKFRDNDLTYQGSYELDFLEKFYDKIDIENGPSISYLFEGKNKVYHSDFYIPSLNLIVEIKSEYTYNENKEVNLIKEEYSKRNGYEFMFIIDKNYKEFKKLYIG